jgi:hypothetical protein
MNALIDKSWRAQTPQLRSVLLLIIPQISISSPIVIADRHTRPLRELEFQFGCLPSIARNFAVYCWCKSREHSLITWTHAIFLTSLSSLLIDRLSALRDRPHVHHLATSAMQFVYNYFKCAHAIYCTGLNFCHYLSERDGCTFLILFCATSAADFFRDAVKGRKVVWYFYWSDCYLNNIACAFCFSEKRLPVRLL